ncbi:hypothetical protein [Caproiciproducens galactitolivorans]|uniref:Uncharacterized protein n=1 Tax=Caproiciproducens galactitolivorans TaxID=642589 RepID=A0A4Z0Y1Y4_9FIRM|nr:hypothetical protein [Caproiciproducens galactitolivorans]TGJ77949.1 hypothetical protein CAGA_03590 [Caproiciproducens galactitolivorans]
MDKGLRFSSQPLFALLAATVVVASASVIVTTAAEDNEDKDDNPRAAATEAKSIVTHNCLPPFSLQYIILRRNKTCYNFLFLLWRAICAL